MIEGPSNIVISGAAQGIGRALARHFASKGHTLYLLDINASGLKHTADTHLSPHASRIAWATCDLSSPSQIRSSITTAIETHFAADKRIDHLICNAGIASPYWSPTDTTMEDPSTLSQWHAYVAVNLTANFALAQACLPYMKISTSDDEASHRKLPSSSIGTAGPCIVFLSSFRAQVSDPNQEGYAATKAGLVGLTKAMAVSLKQFGVRVNCVSPGRIKAAHESKAAEDDDDPNGNAGWEIEGDDVDVHLTNRPGMPEDVCEAVEYMCGAGFVSGQNLVVDGGVVVQKGG